MLLLLYKAFVYNKNDFRFLAIYFFFTWQRFFYIVSVIVR